MTTLPRFVTALFTLLLKIQPFVFLGMLIFVNIFFDSKNSDAGHLPLHSAYF